MWEDVFAFCSFEKEIDVSLTIYILQIEHLLEETSILLWIAMNHDAILLWSHHKLCSTLFLFLKPLKDSLICVNQRFTLLSFNSRDMPNRMSSWYSCWGLYLIAPISGGGLNNTSRLSSEGCH